MPLSKEHREKLRQAKLKNPVRYWLGKKRPSPSEETRRKMKEAALRNGNRPPVMCGENNPKWIKDRTKIKGYWLERNNPEYKQWVKAVKKRDNNICKLKNENCFGYNIAHHIRGWSEYPELKYKVQNGITLCQAHHPRKRAKEKRLIPFFQELVAVS